MKAFFITCFLLSQFCFGQRLDSVSYSINGQQFKSYFVKPNKISDKTKTVLIVHEWWGLNDYVKTRAIQLAKEGYFAFCVDMYGGGRIAKNPADAQALSAPFYRDSAFAYQRFMAGYEQALKICGSNSSRMAAIGYCFGGSIVLNAAKMGAKLDAVVSFHGGLAGIKAAKNTLTAAVLICHGAADNFVPDSEVEAFKKEMNEAEADFKFIAYPNATHAFTNPKATEVGRKFSMPIAYNQEADLKSWKDFKKFMKQKVK